jgi:hypothetical protein
MAVAKAILERRIRGKRIQARPQSKTNTAVREKTVIPEKWECRFGSGPERWSV